MASKYAVVSGAVFGVVAVLQVVRALYQWPVHVAAVDIPVSASWVAAVVAGCLSMWAFRSGQK